MENTTTDKELLLIELNDKRAKLMIPVMMYMVLLMIVGLFGNTMVCYFYGCKSRQSSNTVFIVVLAVYDLILCSLSIPIEIVDLRFFYMFPNSGACKFMRLVTHFAAFGSIGTLLVISADRYRKICCPFKKQLGLKHVKIVCGIVIMASLFFAWPAAVFYRTVRVEIRSDDGVSLDGFDCTTVRDSSYKTVLLVFNASYMAAFIVSAISLCTLYGLVCRVLYKHKNKSRRYSMNPVPDISYSASSSTDQGLNEKEDKKQDDDDQKDKTSEMHDGGLDVRKGGIHLVRTPTLRSQGKPKSHLDVKTIQFTMMMLIITIGYIISFLPHLILSLWRVFETAYEGELFSDAGLVFFQIGIRSYFLNSVINPLTYGFFNPKFRGFFYSMFCPCCGKHRYGAGTIELTNSE